MTQQSGRYDYQEQHRHDGDIGRQIADGSKAAAEKAREIGGEAVDRADEWLKPVGLSIREQPMTCLAVVGGLAFAAGAFWMMRGSRQQSQLDQLLNQAADLSRRARWW